MYLSRIKLNTARTDTMRALAAPNRFHGALESCDDESTRKLWRIDTLAGERYLLILSEKVIDLSKAAEQFGYDRSYESKVYDGLLERIVNGSRWQFRLTANPTIQKYDEKKGRGRVLAHITPEHQINWLKERSVRLGFELNDDEWTVTGSKWYSFRKNKDSRNTVKLLAVTFEGILTVTDADAFRQTLTGGVGREKAYGMGLLTVTRVPL